MIAAASPVVTVAAIAAVATVPPAPVGLPVVAGAEARVFAGLLTPLLEGMPLDGAALPGESASAVPGETQTGSVGDPEPDPLLALGLFWPPAPALPPLAAGEAAGSLAVMPEVASTGMAPPPAPETTLADPTVGPSLPGPAQPSASSLEAGRLAPEPAPLPANPGIAEQGAALLPLAAAAPEAPTAPSVEFRLPLPVEGPAPGRAEPPPAMPPPSPQWPDRLAERLRWEMAGGQGQGPSAARIELAPDELGALEVQLRVEQGSVSLHITAAQPATRELLAEAMPRLRELLTESGLSLGQASVSGQSSAGGDREAGKPRTSATDEDLEPLQTPLPVRERIGLLDDYA